MKTRITSFLLSLTFSSPFSRLPLSYLLLTFLTLFAGSVASAQIPSSGLVGYWPFNGNANDESGNGSNGTVNGATLTADRYGSVDKAYFFNGVDTYIDLASAGLSSDPGICTYSVWFKTDTLYTGLYDETSVLLTKRHVDNGPSWASIQIDQNCNVNFVIDGPAFDQDVPGGSSVCNNEWQHLVCVKNLNVYSVYLNSVLVNSQTVNYTHSGSTMNMHVGHHGAWNTWFYGSIDDIGIWNRVLSLTEIEDLYNGQIDNSIFELNATMNLYPNPAHSELNIQVNSSVIGNFLYIFDAVGKLVLKHQLVSTQTTIPVSVLAAGNYAVRVGELSKVFAISK